MDLRMGSLSCTGGPTLSLKFGKVEDCLQLALRESALLI